MLDIVVLLVDDDDDSRDLLGECLTARGVRVITAKSAEEALRALQDLRPNVIVSDLGMPGEDGLSLVRRVRQLPAGQGGSTPAVALTGSVTSKDRAATLEAGFQAHMAKPVDLPVLVKLITDLAGPSTEAGEA